MKLIQIIVLFFTFLTASISLIFPHKIWLYWNEGEQNLGSFQKLCFQRLIQLHKQTDWEVQLVSQLTISKFLNETNYQKFQKGLSKKYEFPQAKADLLRYYLLMQHGGVWLDVSILLKVNLDWLDNILNDPKVIHRNIFKNPEVFLYIQHQTYRKNQNEFGKQEQKIRININGYDYYPLFSIENAFIAAVKQSRYITDLINQFQLLLSQGQQLYNKEKQLLQIPYTYSDYFLSFRASSINQYKKYAIYQQAKIKNKQLENLQNHFYNILIMNKIAGMYHGSRFPQRVEYYLLHEEGPLGDYENQLIKFSRLPKKFINSIMVQQRKMNQYRYKKYNSQLYEFGKKFVKQKHDCLYQLQIYENSAIDKYLLSNKQLTKKLYPLAQVINQSQLPFICKFTKLSTLRTLQKQFLDWGKYSIILFIGIQILFWYFHYLKISSNSLIVLKAIYNEIYMKLLYVAGLYLQMDLIYSQYQLWIQFSPTAYIVGTIQIIFAIIIFKNILDINFEMNKANEINTKYSCLKLIIIQLIQFFFLFQNSIWKYGGQVYNYQDLNHLNTIKIKEGQFHLLKIFFIIILISLLQIIKKIFKLNISQFSQDDFRKLQDLKYSQNSQKLMTLIDDNTSPLQNQHMAIDSGQDQ